MNLRKFLVMRNLPDEAICVTVGVDDYRLRETSNLMSVSFACPGEEPETVYISGADAAKVEKYTGVSPSYYAERSVGHLRAVEILRDGLRGKGDLLVTYSVHNYTRPWLMRAMSEIFRPNAFLWFDALSYIQYGDEGRPFPVEAADMEQICERVNPVHGMKFAAAVASRLPHPDPYDESDNLPELEQKIEQVQKLWDYCLDREL
jgi:hypothetical protein